MDFAPADKATGNGRAHSCRREITGLTGFCVLFLLALLYSSWGTVFTDDPESLLGMYDHRVKNAPAWFFMDRSIADNDIPLWNPHTVVGAPYAAHPTSRVFYPPNLLRSVLVQAETPRDTVLSLVLLDFFHVFIAGLGMYALARRMRFSMGVSYVTALAVAFSPMFWGLALVWSPVFAATAWSPFILALLHVAIGSRSTAVRLFWLFLAGVLYGFQIQAGFPQAAVVATVGYILFSGCLLLEFHARPLIDWRLPGLLLKWPLYMAFFGLVGVLVALPFLSLASEFLGLVVRSSERFSQYDADANFTAEYFWVIAQRTAGPGLFDQVLAIGAVVSSMWVRMNVGAWILLACVAFVSRNREMWPYLVLLLFFLDLSIGPPMPVSVLFRSLLFFEISHHHYIAGLVSIPFAMLGGFGLESLIKRVRENAFSWRAAGCLFLLGIVLVFALPEPSGLAKVTERYWSILPLSILVCLCGLYRFRIWQPLLIILLLVEIVLCSREIMATRYETRLHWEIDQQAGWMDLPPAAQELPPARSLRSGRSRTSGNSHLWTMSYQTNGYEPLILADTLTQLSNPGEEFVYHRSPNMQKNLYAANSLKRMFWLAPTYIANSTPPKGTMFPPTEVVFLESDVAAPVKQVSIEEIGRSAISEPLESFGLWSIEGGGKVRSRGNVKLIRIVNVPMPAAHKVLRVTYRAEDSQELEYKVYGSLADQVLELGPLILPPSPGEDAQLELPLPDFASVNISFRMSASANKQVGEIREVNLVTDAADESEKIQVQTFSPDRVVLQVGNVEQPSVLVFNDSFYPGWKVKVDGRESELLRANGHVKGVVLEPGSHKVVFVV